MPDAKGKQKAHDESPTTSSSQDKINTLDSLPYDVLFHVIDCLPLSELGALRKVSKFFQEILKDRLIWINHLRTSLALYGITPSAATWPATIMSQPNIQELVLRAPRLRARLNNPTRRLWWSSTYLNIPGFQIEGPKASFLQFPYSLMPQRHVEHVAFVPGGRWIFVVTHLRPHEVRIVNKPTAGSTIWLYDIGDLIEFKFNGPVAEKEFLGKKIINFFADFPLSNAKNKDQSKITVVLTLADTLSSNYGLFGAAASTFATHSLDFEVHVFNPGHTAPGSDPSRVIRRLRLPSGLRIKEMTIRDNVTVTDFGSDLLVWNWRSDKVSRIGVDTPPDRVYPITSPPPALKLTENRLFFAQTFGWTCGPELRIYNLPPLYPVPRGGSNANLNANPSPGPAPVNLGNGTHVDFYEIMLSDEPPVHTVRLPDEVNLMRFEDGPGSASWRRGELWHMENCVAIENYNVEEPTPEGEVDEVTNDDAKKDKGKRDAVEDIAYNATLKRKHECRCTFTMFLHLPNNRLYINVSIPRSGWILGSMVEANGTTHEVRVAAKHNLHETPRLICTSAPADQSTFSCSPLWFGRIGALSAVDDEDGDDEYGSGFTGEQSDVLIQQGHVGTAQAFVHGASSRAIPWNDDSDCALPTERMDGVQSGFLRPAYNEKEGALQGNFIRDLKLDEFSGMAALVIEDFKSAHHVRVMVCDGP